MNLNPTANIGNARQMFAAVVGVQNLVQNLINDPTAKQTLRVHTYITSAPLTDPSVAVVKSEDFFFDAVLRAEHDRLLTITQYPVQDGANITDHSYMNPLEFVVHIGMSDVMKPMSEYFADPLGAVKALFPFGGTKRSVNAYQKLCALQSARQPIRVTSRLQTYDNMLIHRIHTYEDYTTQNSLKCEITFKQILVGTVSSLSQPSANYKNSITTIAGGTVQSEDYNPSAN
jgi:hypothetical protein